MKVKVVGPKLKKWTVMKVDVLVISCLDRRRPSTFTQIIGIFLFMKKYFLWSKNGKITIKSIIDHEPKIGFKTLVLGGWKIFALDFTFIYYFLIDHNWESYDE